MPVASKTTVRLYPPDVEIIDAWASAIPDPDTGETRSRPTAIRRIIRSIALPDSAVLPSDDHAPASHRQLQDAVTAILQRPDRC